MDLPQNTLVVGRDEEIVSLLERIHASAFEELLIVIPRGAAVGQGSVDFKILKREAEQHEKTLRIIAEERHVQMLARRLQISWEGNAERFWNEAMRSGLILAPSIGPDAAVISDVVIPSAAPRIPARREDAEVANQDAGEFISKKPTSAAENREEPFGETPSSADARAETSAEETLERLYREHAPAHSTLSREVKDHSRLAHPFSGGETSMEERNGLSWWILGLFVALAVVLFVVVASVVLPKVDIAVTPRTEATSVEMALTADVNRSSVDAESTSIPGQLLEVRRTLTREFPSTGKRDIAERARGTVTVYNRFSSEPQTLVKTTRFLSDAGRVFRLVDTTTVPGARVIEGTITPSSIEVAVVADEAGEAFNIGPARFTIPGFQGTAKFEGFYGESAEAMSGGAAGIVSVATTDDLKGASALVEEELRTAVTEELRAKVPAGLLLLPGADRFVTTQASTSVEADAPAERFSITLEGRAQAIVVRKEDVGSVVRQRIAKTLAERKEQRPETLTLQTSVRTIDFDGGIMHVTTQASETIAWSVDEDALRDRLRGHDERGVRAALEDYPEVAAVEVTFWPFWVDRVPKDGGRIRVRVQ